MSAKSSSPIDWADAERRVAALAEVLRGADAATPEQIEATLQERARKLAADETEQAASEASLEVIELLLGGERYALETTYIREVIGEYFLTLLPGSPQYFAGVMNLRGKPLLVIDPRRLFQLAVAELTPASRVLVLGGDEADFGLVAEVVVGVDTVSLADIDEAPASVPDVLRRFLRGVTADARLLLDGQLLLDDPRLSIDEE